jgi:uncharacterized membrane protein YGL010W
MKTQNEWLKEYASSHQNRTNRWLHKVCVPLILFTLVGLASLLPLPSLHSAWANGATALSLLCLVFYFRLGMAPFFLMTATFALSIALAVWLNEALRHPALWYLGAFALAWVGQFTGHAIEGKRPSFLQDLQFLLIGPLWVFFRGPSNSSQG